MCTIVPLIVDPDRRILSVTSTGISPGIETGGFALPPVCVVQVSPQALPGLSANPFIAGDAGPPDSELFCAHWGPQKLTAAPIVGDPADLSPITNAPAVAEGSTFALVEAIAGT